MNPREVSKIRFAPVEEEKPAEAPVPLQVSAADSRNWRQFLPPIGILFLIIASGILTGYILSVKLGKGVIGGGVSMVAPGAERKGKEVGSTNLETFSDTATGVIEKGGINGEGSHKLIREGGPSQTAYLTSSVVDLDQFVGKKVQVWGETFSAQKAGWLMDVGRVKILE